MIRALLREEPIPSMRTGAFNHFGRFGRGGESLEFGRIEDRLPIITQDQLPSALNMELDFMDIDPLRQSIEVGRRDSTAVSLRAPSLLPVSPLRTPTKSITGENQFAVDQPELVPLNDNDYAYDNEAPVPEALHDDNAARFSDPPAPLVSRATRRPARRTMRNRRPIPLDEETELPNALIQEYVRDASSILLPKASWNDTFLAETMRAFSISETYSKRPTRSTGRPMTPRPEYEQNEEQVPLNDDNYTLAPVEADYVMDMDIPAPPSPKSPRLMPNEEDVENAVPDFNAQLSAPGTPTKGRGKIEIAELPDETLDTISRWQAAFPSVVKAIGFEHLIVAPAKRKQAADAFIQLLVLQSKGLVKAEQAIPYGPISVKASDSLFTLESNAISFN